MTEVQGGLLIGIGVIGVLMLAGAFIMLGYISDQLRAIKKAVTSRGADGG
jgi:hypothetical protein